MASIIFVLFVTVGVPIFACVYAIYKRRFMPFILGVLAFVISQILIRIPLLEYLAAKSSTYLMWSVEYPVFFVIFLAFTAGIFEESARWIAMSVFMKQRDRLSGVVFGIGHGGIEAFSIVGLAVIATMNISNAYWISGIERLIAICIHIGLSLIVLAAVKDRRLSYLLVAICLHGVINSIAGILSTSGAAIAVIETVLLILAILTLFIASTLLRKGEGK